MLPINQRIYQQFNLREGSKVQSSHNVHERFSAHEQEGICMIANELISTFVTAQDANPEILGRWS